jgi:hypothetical protein
MKTRLPSNDELVAFSTDVPWREIERQKRQFNRAVDTLAAADGDNPLPLEALSDLVGAPISTYYDAQQTAAGNVILAETNNRPYVMGAVVSDRYRSGAGYLESIVPYNLNPSVNHTNISETDDPTTRMRVLGAELELGLVHKNGGSPTEDEMQDYMRAYYKHASRIGIFPKLDREACQYQVEAHIAPSIGYNSTRSALNGILTALTLASRDTDLYTTMLSCYPTESDFKMTDHPKVATAVDLMLEVNSLFPEYDQRLKDAHARYHVTDPKSHHVNIFRNQGCHIHIDLAGRSEALGLLTYHTILKSASAVASGAVLKGGPFVNGTCDPELLCARGYLRSTTVTGHHLDLPTSPHFTPDGMNHYAELLRLERVNAAGRAMLYDDSLGQMVSVMHNPIGRIRPDLKTLRRVCTVESTGMSVNISPSRMAAVLTDLEFSHTVIEEYFRKYGCDLGPMADDAMMWAVLGPLDDDLFVALNDQSDRECSDITLTTAAGTQMRLAEFYDMKRRFMHRALADISEITPRDIDEVYTSLCRMLEPPSGKQARTINEYINDPKLRSTGNWGQILRDAFVEAGGVPGQHCPDIVMDVVTQINEAVAARWLAP